MENLFETNKVSQIGLGTWQLGLKGWGSGYEENELVEALRLGIKNGLNFVDTAEIYGMGKSESLVGTAVSAFDRKEYYIATKLAGFNASASRVRKSLTSSIKRLGCEYVDLYQVHWEPSAYTNLPGLFKELEKNVKEGLIGHIGVSNFSAQSIEKANNSMKESKIESNQIKFNVVERPSADLMKFLKVHNIKLIAWSPLAQGFLTGKYTEDRRPSGNVRRINRLFSSRNFERFGRLISELNRISEARKVSPVQIVLAYERQLGVLPIPGFRDTKQISEILSVNSLHLHDEEIASLDKSTEEHGTIQTSTSFYPRYLPNFIARIGFLFM